MFSLKKYIFQIIEILFLFISSFMLGPPKIRRFESCSFLCEKFGIQSMKVCFSSFDCSSLLRKFFLLSTWFFSFCSTNENVAVFGKSVFSSENFVLVHSIVSFWSLVSFYFAAKKPQKLVKDFLNLYARKVVFVLILFSTSTIKSRFIYIFPHKLL